MSFAEVWEKSLQILISTQIEGELSVEFKRIQSI